MEVLNRGFYFYCIKLGLLATEIIIFSAQKRDLSLITLILLQIVPQSCFCSKIEFHFVWIIFGCL